MVPCDLESSAVGVPDEDPVAFTTCGQTGHLGPNQTQCDAEYLGTDLENSVNVSGGVHSGLYRILEHEYASLWAKEDIRAVEQEAQERMCPVSFSLLLEMF